MPRKHAESVFPGINEQHQEVLREFHNLNKKVDILMTKADDTAAAVTANTTAIRQVSQSLTGLAEGHESIIAEIQALKDQIAQGTQPDFTALDAAVTDQTQAIGDLGKLVPTT